MASCVFSAISLKYYMITAPWMLDVLSRLMDNAPLLGARSSAG